MSLRFISFISAAAISLYLFSGTATPAERADGGKPVDTGPVENLVLPSPFATPSVRNTSKVIGWPKGRMPKAAPGFEVSLFADELDTPRSAYILPNGDVLVVESTREWPDRPDKSANRIMLFRDTNKDGKPDVREVFLTGLHMPYGMLLVGNWLYVGNTNGLVRYP